LAVVDVVGAGPHGGGITRKFCGRYVNDALVPEHAAVTEYTPTGRFDGMLMATAHRPSTSATVDADAYVVNPWTSFTWTDEPPSGHCETDRLLIALGR
jgi:hypothetical protein